MVNIEFSVLSYYPSYITTESINLGVLFHNIDENLRIFEPITKWKRVKSFDDEVDIDVLKTYLEGINQEIKNDNILNCDSRYCLHEYTKFYVNELKFSKITLTTTSNFKKFVEDTKKVFLHFDYNRKDRLSKDQKEIYIKQLLESQHVNVEKGRVTGYFEEKVDFDFIIDGYAVKFFNFEGKNLPYLISNAKTWAYTAQKLNDKYKTIFIYDIERDEDANFRKIINILKEDSYKTVPLKDSLEILMKLKTA